MKSGHVLDRHRCQGSFYIQKANRRGTAESRGLAARPPRVFPAALLLRFLGEMCPAAERGLELDMQTAITTLLGFCLFVFEGSRFSCSSRCLWKVLLIRTELQPRRAGFPIIFYPPPTRLPSR